MMMKYKQTSTYCKKYATKARATMRNANKLSPNREGPFKIIEQVGKGAYKLEHLDKRRIPCTWNMTSLRFYYS
ncbi:hypothetical protein CR513_51991, partial [Mucuna pruriens]